jgi:hypothetical protein
LHAEARNSPSSSTLAGARAPCNRRIRFHPQSAAPPLATLRTSGSRCEPAAFALQPCGQAAQFLTKLAVAAAGQDKKRQLGRYALRMNLLGDREPAERPWPSDERSDFDESAGPIAGRVRPLRRRATGGRGASRGRRAWRSCERPSVAPFPPSEACNLRRPCGDQNHTVWRRFRRQCARFDAARTQAISARNLRIRKRRAKASLKLSRVQWEIGGTASRNCG